VASIRVTAITRPLPADGRPGSVKILRATGDTVNPDRDGTFLRQLYGQWFFSLLRKVDKIKFVGMQLRFFPARALVPGKSVLLSRLDILCVYGTLQLSMERKFSRRRLLNILSNVL
jgi:hypothetical protein